MPSLTDAERAVFQEQREARETLAERAKRERCTAGHDLTVAYVDQNYRLRCKCGYDPETRLVGAQGVMARFRRGESMSVFDYLSLSRQLERNIRTAESSGDQPNPKDLQMLRLVRERAGYINNVGEEMTSIVTTSTKNVMARDEAERFVDLAKLETGAISREMAVAYLERTGLNPLANEVCVYEGKLYPMVDGLRHLALDSNLLDGADPPKFLTAAEKQAEGYAPDDIVCRIGLHRKGVRLPFIGTGKANRSHTHRNSAVEAAWGPRTAENRAYRHAWRQAFQDLLTERGIHLPPETLDEHIDPVTGEIIEGTFSAAAPVTIPDAMSVSRLPVEPTASESQPDASAPPSSDGVPTVCPDHGVEWFQSPKMKTFAHKIADSDKWCNRPGWLKDRMDEASTAAGADLKDAQAWCKETFGRPPSGLTEAEIVVATEHWREVLLAAAENELPFAD